MSENQEVRYMLDFGARNFTGAAPGMVDAPIPRIARLLALAIRLERLIRDQTIRDYAEVARRGWVTRARMAIMSLKT